jgi:hypothetical protein
MDSTKDKIKYSYKKKQRRPPIKKKKRGKNLIIRSKRASHSINIAVLQSVAEIGTQTI